MESAQILCPDKHPGMRDFWDTCRSEQSASIAFIDENDQPISYGELDRRIDTAVAFLHSRGTRQFGALFLSNTIASMVAYLACLRAGHVPLLLPVDLAEALAESLITHYQPDWVMGRACGEALPGSGLAIKWKSPSGAASTPLATDLALLLSTSGSTGSPKLVRLSYNALRANAHSIAEFLTLDRRERALTVLPPYYSYGLSVINSHLAAGASLILRDTSVLSPDFVAVIRRHEVTSISGVPYIYQMLHRTAFYKQDMPSLRTLTQAGGRLDDRMTRAFVQIAAERGWRFFIMYGQTEATARMSFIPPERLIDKVGSIGIAIPQGELSVDPSNGEIVYRGPNVMMGYAEHRDELALGDELNGLLRTGDLGRLDDDGFLYVTGRLKRFIKLAGNRIGLDEVEQMLQEQLAIPVSVGGRDERMVVWLETQESTMPDAAKQLITRQYAIHHSLCRIKNVDQLALLPSGKKDYKALMVDS
jgi:long-chain acyl-CoA synthetase